MEKEEYQHHISQKFNEEMASVRAHLLEMGGMVEAQAANATEALVSGNEDLARSVLNVEKKINELEKTIDEECSRIIVLRQPAASDLRMIIAVSKAVADLERIGDEASKIAKMALELHEEGESPRGYMEVRHISSHVRSMLRDVLDAFARSDVEKAVQVAKEDTTVDAEYGTAMRSLATFMMEDPRAISKVLNVIWALRSLERIGDHARNIGEQVIYLVQGQDVRHLTVDEMQEQVNEGAKR